MILHSLFNSGSRILRSFRRTARRRIGPEIKLEAVLAAMMDAVVITDKSGLFIDFNEPFAHLNRFKTKSDCALALDDYRTTFEASLPDGTVVEPDDWPIPRALRGELGVNVELKLKRRDTHDEWIGMYNYAPIRTDDGSIVGAVLTGRDITDFRHNELDLRNLSSRLHLALTSAHLGVWEWEVQQGHLSWDDRMFALYGVRREEFPPNVDSWKNALHPEDRSATVELLNAAIRGEKNYDTEFRVVHPDGTVRHLKANGLVLRGADGRPLRMLGVNADITEEKLAKQRLEAAYAEVEAKVVERTAQLETAKVAAENASKAKDLFLATLSHELRSPLSAILSWTQLMERGVLSPEKLHVGIRTIKESVWAQNQLIGDLLDLSRISTGKLSIDRQPTEVGEVLRVAIESVRPSAEQRGLVLEEHFEAHDTYVSADPARLKQCFWNILSNAVKFTPSGGKIFISVKCDRAAAEPKVEIAIRDTGRGIKPEFIPHLFEPFTQADRTSIRVHGGMGLGLSLVKSFAELQGGTIKADSAGEGRGATFTLTFPLLGSSLYHTLDGATGSGVAGVSNDSSLSGVKVLLVEDGERTRIALAQLLAAQGANVRAEASAKEGLEAFKIFKPDVLVSDIAMPQEDGHSLMRKIRGLCKEEGGDTPAVALTAYAEPRERDEAFASGFQEYLNKPVDVSTLSDTILRLKEHSRVSAR